PLDSMRNEHTELISYQQIKSEETFIAEGLKITPIAVSHTVLTHGLIVEDDRVALLFTSDTGATDHIWHKANDCEKLRAVFVDISFPNRLTDLARISCHHSPATFQEELPKLKSKVQIFAVHLKAPYREEVEREIAALKNPRITVAEIGREYKF